MKQLPTKEQVLDALQTHKTVQKAAKALGLSYPKMRKCLRWYGIVCNHNAKQVEPEPSAPSLPWYKRMFKKEEVQ